MTTDLHCHFIPDRVVAFLRQRRAVPRIEMLPDGTERLLIPGTSLAFDTAYTDIEARLAFMDQIGVRRQVLSLPGLFGIDSLPLAEAGPALRAFNEETAAVCRRYPQRFLGLAALPLADMDAAVAELRRARQELGLIGAILPNNAFTSLEQASRMQPLFEAGQALACHFFIHPGRRPDEAAAVAAAGGVEPASKIAADNGMQRRALEVQADVAQAMVTLLFTDFLDPYPAISLHVANLGGTLPAVIERMDHTVKARGLAMALPSERVRRVHVDCSSLGPRTLELAVAIYGADRIVLGTDCPIFRADWTLDAIRAARLSDSQREAILHGNANRLLARFEPAPG